MASATQAVPTVRQALVHAASYITTRDQTTQVLQVDMRPLVIHLLAGLEKAGVERAVVTLGHHATELAECVAAYGFKLKVDFVWLTLGSAGAAWHNLANSIIAARTAFRDEAEPLLIVRADQLYDWRLLRKIADAPFSHGLDAFALVDTSPPTLRWADGQFCSRNCRRGACHALAKVARGEDGNAIRCGHRLGAYDAVVAGDVYATKPILFGVLSRLFAQSFSVTIADAMQELAAKGTLGCVEVGSLNCHWFATKTLARVFQPAADASSPHTPWADTVAAARELLYSGEWRATCSMPTQPSRGDIEKRTQPLLRLGVAVGRGANCLVVEAQAGLAAKGGQSSRLAVKMFSTDHAEGNAQVEAVMREVHVLRQLNHPNIVRLCDVVEMADALYVVMERVEGPDLLSHIQSQPAGALPEPAARRMFAQLLCAVRHAHLRGYLHCDLKPQNVRLTADCESAVLVDWGLARHVLRQPAIITQGLGATQYEMIVGTPPFAAIDDKGTESFDTLVVNVVRLDYQLPDQLSLEVRQLIDAMLQVQPSDRASVAELCLDPWVTAAGPVPPDTGGEAVECGECEPTEAPAWGLAQLRGLVVRRWRPAAFALLYGLLLVGGAAMHVRGGRPVAVQREPGTGGRGDDVPLRQRSRPGLPLRRRLLL